MNRILFASIFFVLFLFLSPSSVSAHNFGTFTASNYFYDSTTHHLTFDATNFSAVETGWYPEFGISSPTWNPNYAYQEALVLPPGTTHFEDNLVQFPNSLPTDSTNVSLYVFGATSDTVFLSQPIPASELVLNNQPTPTPTITPTPTPSVPENKDDCKENGWMNFVGFKNQGSCVSFVEKLKNFFHL